MRLFEVKSDSDAPEFVEYREKSFGGEYREEVLEAWLASNPEAIVEDGALLVIGRQVATNFNTYIDLLALDRDGNVVVIELKRDRTPRDTLAQALEYASFVEGLSYNQLEKLSQEYTGESGTLENYHRLAFSLEEGEAVSFNKDQRIVIVGCPVCPEIRQSSRFLSRKGVRVTCVEFAYFRSDSGEQLLSSEIVVGKESEKPIAARSEAAPRVNRATFLDSLDEFGRPVFEAILEFAERERYFVIWGSRGFSMNVDIGGSNVVLCYGFPPAAVFRQTIYTEFQRLRKKIAGGSDVADSFRNSFLRTGLFVNAAREAKCVLDRPFDKQEIETVIGLLGDLGTEIKKRGLVE